MNEATDEIPVVRSQPIAEPEYVHMTSLLSLAAFSPSSRYFRDMCSTLRWLRL
jgi:hypothetical protein